MYVKNFQIQYSVYKMYFVGDNIVIHLMHKCKNDDAGILLFRALIHWIRTAVITDKDSSNK